ncbi:MAG: radical SAM family heme chaperone HemW [Clostridia bacterium]|nr:radical SAM family heme chaperone HemW [Clostridia bacterium]
MSNKNLGIYIHVPFCRSKCPYCDFYSQTDDKYIENYVVAVCRDLEIWGKKVDKTVDTVYFGGGTPSILSTDSILKILGAVKGNFKVNSPEITLELNPGDTTKLDFERLHFNGLNRVSVGAQSMSDSQLKVLGRRHNVSDVKEAVNLLKQCGINNISLDLILGVPEQKNSDIDNFVNFCTENDIPHISAYILKIEEGTPYYFNKSGLKFLDDDELADFYTYTCQAIKKCGYEHYEISNFSKSGFESRHNLKYWNMDDYLGVGPAAHSFLNGKRFYYPKNLKAFINDAKIAYEESDLEKEFIMLALRTKKGLINEFFKKKIGYDLPNVYFKRAKKFEKYGLVKCSADSIKINESGFLISNAIISEII